MKKILCVCSLIFVVLFLVSGLSLNNNYYQEYHRFMPANTIETKLYENSGGFARDGILLYSYEFDNDGKEKFVNYIYHSKGWNSMPLPADLVVLLYGSNNYSYNYGIKSGLPQIKNGYWLYKPYREGNYLECHRFSLSLYDTDNNTLYLLKVKI